MAARQVATDLFGDFASDLIHVNSTNQLVVEVGDGSGGFASPVTVSLGFNPLEVSFGDFNGDGLKDLVALHSDGVLSLSLNNGAGGFLAAVPFSVGLQLTESITDFAIDDLNGDGNLDVAVNISGVLNARVGLFYGNGSGGFSPVATTEINLLTIATVSFNLADINADGTVDISVKDVLGTVYVILSDGMGGYNTPTTIAGLLPTGRIFFTDYNHDQIPDMIVLDEILGVVTIRLGNGDGTFLNGVGINVGTTPVDVLSVDLNLDGHRDLAVINVGDNSINVFIGDGLGGLVELVGTVLEDLLGVIPVLSMPIAIVSADFNGDCRLDIGIWNDLTQSYTVQLNQSGPDPNDLIYCSRFED